MCQVPNLLLGSRRDTHLCSWSAAKAFQNKINKRFLLLAAPEQVTESGGDERRVRKVGGQPWLRFYVGTLLLSTGPWPALHPLLTLGCWGRGGFPWTL